MPHMKSIASVLSIIALGFGLIGCPSSGGGGGGGSTQAFAVSTTAADFGVVGNAYSSTLSATGGTPPYTWTDVASELPPLGLALNPATGVISGTPTTTTATAFAVTFQVTDSAGGTASGSVTLRLRPRTDRASVDTAGNSVAGSSNTAPSISRTSGRFIAFSSTANLVTGVTGNQVYVHDRRTGQPSLVSRDNESSSINQGNGSSSVPSISADGRFVAFVSQATNLLAPAVPAVVAGQIYVRDFQTGQTSLVSRDSSGGLVPGNAPSSTPSISGDGRFVVFVSSSTNLVAGVTSGTHVYIRDTQANQTSLVSQDNSGGLVAGNAPSSAPTISSDGRYVAFASQATNLLAPGTASVPAPQIYLRDTVGNITTLVSQDNAGNPATAGSNNLSPVVATNGAFVAFVSSAPNLVTLPSAAAALDVYVRALP